MPYLTIAAIKDLDLTGLPQVSADQSLIATIISIIIAITAAISLVVITVAGLRYILSRGDPQAVAKAKGAIIYALIGLIIAIVAQAIVIFVVKGIS